MKRWQPRIIFPFMVCYNGDKQILRFKNSNLLKKISENSLQTPSKRRWEVWEGELKTKKIPMSKIIPNTHKNHLEFWVKMHSASKIPFTSLLESSNYIASLIFYYYDNTVCTQIQLFLPSNNKILHMSQSNTKSMKLIKIGLASSGFPNQKI